MSTYTSARYGATKAEGARWANFVRPEGFRVSVRTGIIELSCAFTPDDVARYREAEQAMLTMLGLVPQTSPGSTWGDTSDGVGGDVALRRGSMSIKVSGVSKNFAAGVAATTA